MIAKYTKDILKNTNEKSGIRIFQFFALNTILWDIYDGWLHFLGPNASFDTYIDIHTYGVCHSIYDILTARAIGSPKYSKIYKGNSEKYKGKSENRIFQLLAMNTFL